MSIKNLKELEKDKGLLIFDIKRDVTTAGPSPIDNKRTEVFLLGCKKAIKGNPCKGCFNSITWDNSKATISRDPIEIADYIIANSNSKYITIGGGEPTDQLPQLIPFLKRLKKNNYHIIMYTWRNIIDILNGKVYEIDKEIIKDDTKTFYDYFKEAIKYIDIIIDGEFIQEEKLWNPQSKNIAYNFIGSGNQTVYDMNFLYGYEMKYIKNLKLTNDNSLIYLLKEKNIKKDIKNLLIEKE